MRFLWRPLSLTALVLTAGTACSKAKERANTQNTMAACNSLRSAALLWLNGHPGGGCPLPEQLIHDKLIEDQFSINDPWGNPYKLACRPDEVVCTTAGPDRIAGTPDDITVPSGAPTAVAATSALPPPPPAPTTVTVSVATFTPKDTLLDECTDMTFPLPRGTDAGAADVADRFAKLLLMPGGKKNTLSRIYRPCTEQFQDSAPLATCVSHQSWPLTKPDAGNPLTLEIDTQERYYDLDSLTNSNEYMKDCLDMKGDWHAVDKNSEAYRDAVRARARRELGKATKLLGQ